MHKGDPKEMLVRSIRYLRNIGQKRMNKTVGTITPFQDQRLTSLWYIIITSILLFYLRYFEISGKRFTKTVWFKKYTLLYQ